MLTDFESKVMGAIDRISVAFNSYDLATKSDFDIIEFYQDVGSASNWLELTSPPSDPNYEGAIHKLRTIQNKLAQEAEAREINLESM